MKKIAVLLVSILMMTVMLAGCSGSKSGTLENLISSDQEVSDEIKGVATENGIDVDIKGNEVTYTYDISDMDGVTDELVESEGFTEMFQSSLDSQKSTFADICVTLEEKTDIEGVSVKVVYIYKDKEIASATFTSADA